MELSREQIQEAESLIEAIEYIYLFYREKLLPESQLQERLSEVFQDYRRSRTYWQTEDELIYGAKVAWRNSSRCIGRIFWESLIVRDLRHLTTAAEIFAALVEHIQQATNGGSIRSTISIFAPDSPRQPGIRIWNSQLIRYAGYRQPDGSIVGDPEQVELTELLKQIGWAGGAGTQFDLLPLIIQMPRQRPQIFELPPEIVMEVPLTHPDYPWFAELGLKWHALPAVSNLRLEIGGISYSAAPFNAWYMSAEIASRNLGDVHWGAIVAPISAWATEVFHHEYENVCLKPNFFEQPEPWLKARRSGGCPFH